MAKTGRDSLFPPMKTKKLKLEMHIHGNVAQLHDGGDSALCAITPRPGESLDIIAGSIAAALRVPIFRYDGNGQRIEKKKG